MAGNDGSKEAENAALTLVAGVKAKKADATLTLARSTLDAILVQKIGPKQAIDGGLLKVDGKPQALAAMLRMLESFPSNFGIVLPNPVLH